MKTHRMYVATICGKPFGFVHIEDIAPLLKASEAAIELGETESGYATRGKGQVSSAPAQMLSRLEQHDVVCTDCEEQDDGGGPDIGNFLGALLTAKRVG